MVPFVLPKPRPTLQTPSLGAPRESLALTRQNSGLSKSQINKSLPNRPQWIIKLPGTSNKRQLSLCSEGAGTLGPLSLIVLPDQCNTSPRHYALFSVINDRALYRVLMDTNAFYQTTVCSRLGEKTRRLLFDPRQARWEIDRNSIRNQLISCRGLQVIRAPHHLPVRASL